MIKLTKEKIAEITSRYNDKAVWASKEPFYKGMFWSETGGSMESDEYVGEWTYKTRRPNLLIIELPVELRRVDITATKLKHPMLVSEIAALEEALDGTDFIFADEKDFFADGFDGGRETVKANWVHTALFANSVVTSDYKIEVIAKVARRLMAAAKLKIPGVVLSYSPRYMGYGDHYSLGGSGKGYRLISKQQELVLKETDTSIDTQSQGLDVSKTPSLYSKLLRGLIDPLFSYAKARDDYSQDSAGLPAAIVADMVAHGVTSVIIGLGDGKEFVLTNLDESASMRTIAQRMHGIIDNCHQIAIVRALPAARPRHRFYVVGKKIVADSSWRTEKCADGLVTLVEYAKRDGPANLIISTKLDSDDVKTMRNFCEANLGRISHFRPNWIIDIELADGLPYLVGIDEIFNGDWFGNVESKLLDALALQQGSNFSEEELSLSGFLFSYGPKRKLSPKRQQRFVHGVAQAEIRDEIADLLDRISTPIADGGPSENQSS